MKKIISFLLIIPVLISSMSFTVSSHYCMGKKVKSSIGIGTNSISCGMVQAKLSCDDKAEVKSNCCQNQFLSLLVDDDKTSENNQFDFSASFINGITPITISLLRIENKIITNFQSPSPPEVGQDIPVFIQSFRI